LDQDRARLTAAADEACRQAATYREERDAALRWQTEAARLSNELDAERSAVAGLRSELQASQATSQTQAEATQQALAGLCGERDQARAEVQRLGAAVKEQEEALRRERDRLDSELDGARAEGERVATQLQDQQRQADGLRSRLEELRRSLEEETAGREQARRGPRGGGRGGAGPALRRRALRAAPGVGCGTPGPAAAGGGAAPPQGGAGRP